MTKDAELLRRAGGVAARIVNESATIAIDAVADIVTARQRGREMALRIGFSETEATLIATIISELARNIVLYAQRGEIGLESTSEAGKSGLVIVSRDQGPGIPDVQRAMVGGYSTSGGLGLGLSGVQRMVDELHIDTRIGKGTVITAKKWLS
jgi:serine/threonine-protein kinase RsbT